MGRRIRALAPWAAVLACAGGAPPAEPPAEAAGAHAVHSQRLRRTMDQLDRVRWRRLPQELDGPGHAQQREQREQLAAAASQLAVTAADIPSGIHGLGLPEADRRAFEALSRQLRAAALRLASDAPTATNAEIAERVAAIDAVCADCHERFRLPMSSP